MSKRPRHSRGISTLELLVGAALTLVMMGTLFSFFSTQQRAMATQSTYAQSQNVTRTVIDLFARELRMASFDPSGTAIPMNVGVNCPEFRQAFVEATPTRLRFRQDLNGTGTINAAGEDIVYELVGNEIRRQDMNVVGGAAIPLVSNVPTNGLRFRYYDGSNPPSELVPVGSPPALPEAQRNCIAKVRFSVRANLPNPNPRITTTVVSAAESEVAVRNRSLKNF
jgi:Tfp pilus assembly protein PilW